MRTSQNALSKTEHRKGAAGYRQGAGRVPSDVPFIKRGPETCRLLSVSVRSGPVRLVEGRLATSNFKYLPGIIRAPLDN